ncbi:glycosyltransferase [Kriegella sp. EG-1]|nr:glycosyltransferase [Flavobacteriaceae bacterium EG-1]
MNLLFIGSFAGSENIYKAQIELILLLSLKVDAIVVGNFSEEIQKVFDVNSIKTVKAFPKKKFDKSYGKTVERIINDNSIDIVQFFSGKASRSILYYGKKNSVKYVSYFGSISLHWYDASSYFTYLSPKLDAIVCNSNFVYNHVKKQLIGNNKQKATMIYKGYDSSWFEDVVAFDYSQMQIPKNAVKICLVGNHRSVKGIKYFINSFNYLNTEKDVHYIVIGNKTDSEDFKKLKMRIPNAEKIHLLGLRKDAVSLIKGADIYTQTSLSEGLGRAICEAMSLEKPIVMTDAGGCVELIDENSGIVVPLKNSKEIGKAISKLVNDESLRKIMGVNAKKRIDNEINIQKNADECYSLYKRLLIG